MKSLQLQKPHILVVVGLPGSGKSFFASQFSETFNAPYLDYGRYQKIIGDERAAIELATDALFQLLKTNQTVVVEEIGKRRFERTELARIAKKHHYDVLYVWVQTEPQTARQRALSSKASNLSENEFTAKSKQFENLRSNETHVVISGKHTYASQAKTVLKRLISDRPASSADTNRGDGSNRVTVRSRAMG